MLVEKKNKIFKFNIKNENLQVLAKNSVKKTYNQRNYRQLKGNFMKLFEKKIKHFRRYANQNSKNLLCS